ncbi:MAG: hypothetical protein L0Y32_02395 [Nevskiales bacterium]|nr:hypothetical protein [Nevskiales bacterium]
MIYLRRAEADTTLIGARKFLIVDTISWRSHLETSMEVALTEKSRGTSVHYVNMREILPRVEDHTWLPHFADANAFRISRAKKLLAKAGVNVFTIKLSRAERVKALTSANALLRNCPDRVSLGGLCYGDFTDIGWGVLSSVIQLTRTPFVSVLRHQKMITEFLASSILTYDLVRREIRKLAPEAVVLFNGRFATTRAILRAAENCSVKPVIHERGFDKDHYRIATESIHDPDYVQNRIRTFWKPELARAGQEFFEGRRKKVEKAWFSYTKRQVVGKVPDALKEGTKWVVFFTTSEDEYVAIGDKYSNPHFPTQCDAILATSKAVGMMPGFRLCVRLHPHIAQKSREQIAFWRNFKIPGALIVWPEEDFDSYAIMERAYTVCTYGSTMGVEATYWGKPSMLLSRSIYDKLNVSFNARGLADIRSFLEAPKVHPVEGALMYGAFYSSFGVPFKYYKARDLMNGEILGIVLDALPVRLYRTLRDFSLWKPFRY